MKSFRKKKCASAFMRGTITRLKEKKCESMKKQYDIISSSKIIHPVKSGAQSIFFSLHRLFPINNPLLQLFLLCLPPPPPANSFFLSSLQNPQTYYRSATFLAFLNQKKPPRSLSLESRDNPYRAHATALHINTWTLCTFSSVEFCSAINQ